MPEDVCTWTLTDGQWTVIDRCDHDAGFRCADAPGKVDGNFVTHEEVQTPEGRATKITVKDKEFFLKRVQLAFATLGWTLTESQRSLLRDPPVNAVFEVPCVKMEEPGDDGG